MTYSKKNKKHNVQTTRKLFGGIGKLQPLSEADEAKERQRAIDFIKEILIAKRNGENIIQITDPKETGRIKKATGKASEIKDVYINNKKLDRRAISYIFAELTGIDKFRVDHTTTSGEYRGNKILGKQMRQNSDMMNGVEYVDGRGKTIKLLGIRELIDLYYDDYSTKYLSDTIPEPQPKPRSHPHSEHKNSRPKKIEDLLDSNPLVIPKDVGVFKEEPVVIPKKLPSAIEAVDNALASLFSAPPAEPFDEPKEIEESIYRCPNGQHINHKTNKCEPVYRKIKTKLKIQPESEVKITVAKPIIDTGFTKTEDAPIEEKPKVPVSDEKPKEKTIFDAIAATIGIPPLEPLPKPNSDISSPPISASAQSPQMSSLSLLESKPPEKIVYQTESRNLSLEKEREEFENNRANTEYDFLYPHLNDPNFNIKIAKRKEFNDTKYDGTIYDVKKQAEIMCQAEFELMPHQLFVKNFLSFQTPYNSLLLYHSLGTGKTCSAIGVAEEMRSYLKQVGVTQKIMIVASPNVQVNFRMQLFNEKKLEEINGIWNLDTCVGNKLLHEINPTNLKGLTRERVISEIRALINTYYVFMGYGELANYISKVTNISQDTGFSMAEKKSIEMKKIKKNFNNRLIIIDEVHNIRISDDNKEKRTAELLMTVAKHSDNMRLLLLSATPMYNSYKEIIWLLNLINANDKRATVSVNDVFDKEGNFKAEKKLEDGRVIEGGREILVRKLTGYISYVRGENPYTFPLRIYPDLFSPENLITATAYPTTQMNNKPIENPIQSTPVYTTAIGEYQNHGYEFIMNYLITKSFNKTNAYGVEINMPSFENMESFGYTLLLVPLEALNIVYPNPRLDSIITSKMDKNAPSQPEINTEDSKQIIDDMVGKRGLAQIMDYATSENPPLRYDFEYKPQVYQNYGRIFSQEKIGKYSAKIARICQCILQSTGIVLVYSQYIDGGSVPIALALEELGFARYGSAPHTRNLFKTAPVEPIDATTMMPKSLVKGTFNQARYVMITGDKYFSPDNGEDMKFITDFANSNGSQVKVVLISKAASEGLDFKCIRQIHILEPWYNMNRIEQIVGRGVRNLSHCSLPFEDRNVEIYLHGTLPKNDIEPADLYVYRLAEKKTKQIGQVTRLLKETAVDCLLNIGQTNFTVEKFLEIAENANIKINLSSKKTIDYQIGDKPFTNVCDYMDNCAFTCSPNAEIDPKKDIRSDTYGEDFVKTNYEMILKRIRQMFREQSVYRWIQIENFVNAVKTYPKEQIFYTLTQLIDDKNEYILDKYGRRGYLVNKGEYYAFQPLEVSDMNASTFDRSVPVDYKRESVFLKLPELMTRGKEKEEGDAEPNADEDMDLEKPMSYEEIMADIQANLKIALDQEASIDKGETDWYKHVAKVSLILQEVYNLTILEINRYIYDHYLDSMKFVNKLTLIMHMYSGTFEAKNINEEMIKSYFDDRILINGTTRGFLLADENECKIYIQSKEDSRVWEEAKLSDKQKVSHLIMGKYIIAQDKYKDEIIGFMHIFTRSKKIVFKVKDTKVERNIGAKLENETKGDIIKTLNKILGEKTYTTKNTEKIMKIGLCVIAEIYLRDVTREGEKILFFDTETALMNNIGI